MAFFDSMWMANLRRQGYLPLQGIDRDHGVAGMDDIWYRPDQDAYFRVDGNGNTTPINRPNGVYGGIVGQDPPAASLTPEELAKRAAAKEAKIEQAGVTGTNGGPNPGETINDFLVRMLNSGMARDQAIAAAGQAFGLAAGQDGYPSFYPANGTIGLSNGYLVLENGVWKNVPRGPEGGTGTLGDVTKPFTGEAPPGWMPPGGAPGAFDYPTFKEPTAEDVYADPGYKFRLGEGERALEQSASGQGTLRTGGTLKNVLQFGQDFATKEYGNVLNRKFGEYAFDFGRAKDIYSTNKNTYDTSYDNAWKAYLAGNDIFHQNQDSAFDKIYKEQNLGLNAASA